MNSFKIKHALVSLTFLFGAFLAHAAVTGANPFVTLQQALAAMAAFGGDERNLAPAAAGPGLGNLSYNESELFKPISMIKPESSPGAGDGDIPYRAGQGYGTNVTLMVNGYMLVMFAPDSGVSPGGFLVYDVSNPRALKLVKRIYEPSGRTAEFREPHAIGSAVINGRQYVVVPSTRGVEFWDFTDINNIQQVKKLVLPTVAGGDYNRVTWQVSWQAPYLYVASSDEGVYIVDARDPANAFIADRKNGRPNPVPTGELGGFRIGPIFTMGNQLVVTSMEASSGLATLDISDPLNPRLLDAVGAVPYYYATCFDGNKLYGSARGTGARMWSYDLSNAGQFVAEDNKLVIDDQLYCSTQDQYVFQGAQEKIHKVDVTNPQNHVEVGHGGLFPEGSDQAHHSDHGQVTPYANLIYVGNDHGTGSGFIVHDRNPDRTAPKVRQVSPRNGSLKQALTSRIGIGMTDNILPESVNTGSFIVRPVGGGAVAGLYSVQLGMVNFAPASPLLPNTTYEVVVTSGGLRDYAGNAVATEFKTTFTTTASEVLDSVLNSWPLASNLKDVVGHDDGAASGSDVFTDGALNLSGRAGGVNLANDSVANTLGGSASLSFHLKTTQAGNDAPWLAPGIFGRDQVGGVDDIFWGWIDAAGFLHLSVGNASNANPGVRSATAINDGEWHQVVITRDANTGDQAIYVDGAKSSGRGTTGMVGLTNKFQMLGQIQGNPDFIKGSLSNVRIFGRTLTDDEVASLSDVVNSWPLLSSVDDVVGGNNGKPSSEDLFNNNGLNFGARTSGVTLDRADTAVTLANSASVTFHMQTTQGGNALSWQAPGIFGRDNVGGADDIFWGWIDDGGRLCLSVGDPTANNVTAKSSKAVNDGQWHFVVMTRDADNGEQTVYVDGVKSRTTGTAGIKGLANKFQMLGQIQGNADFFKGTLTNVRIYGRTLSESEAAMLYSQSIVRVIGKPGDEIVQVNQSATFNPTELARAGAQYSWNFGDGTAHTPFSTTLKATHTFTQTGHYTVILTVRNADGTESYYSFLRTAINPLTAKAPTNTTNITGDATQVYSVNQDSGTVTALNAANLSKAWETKVGKEPRTLAVAPDGRIWVTVQDADKLVVLKPNGTIDATIKLPYGSGPHGVVFTPDKQTGLVTLESKSQLMSFDPATGATRKTLDLTGDVRGIAVRGDSSEALVTRFRSTDEGGQVHRVTLATMAKAQTIGLQVDNTTVDAENRSRGVPNYLHQIIISPDGKRAMLPSKKDNILRGLFRDGQAMEHDKTVRSIVSQIDLKTPSAEVFAEQLDFNDRAVARAAVYSPNGDYLFVAQMEGNRIAIVDAYNRSIRGEIPTGRAPQGLYLDEKRKRLFLNNFLDRSIASFDVAAVLTSESFAAKPLGVTSAVAQEPLTVSELRGKQLFYNAADQRMSLNGYMSCASCHVDGGDDGTTWDFTQRGEGLRSTITLKGRAGLGHGRVHWTANFDEIQDFENDIRNEFAGTGFLSDADFNATKDPLGAPKAGKSQALDDLAAYVSSLKTYPRSPARKDNGKLTSSALNGQTIFKNLACASCHTGTTRRDGLRHDVGTIQPSSGKGINQPLPGVGFDTPTIQGVWATAPYFHNGQAATLNDVVDGGHGGTGSLSAAEKRDLVRFLRSLDGSKTEKAALAAAEAAEEQGSDASNP